jgi:multiple sugar transport system permease protein
VSTEVKMSAASIEKMTSLDTSAVFKQPRLDRARFRLLSLPLLAPALVLLAVFFIYPVAYSIYLGFTNLQLMGPHSVHYHFTGWKNVNFLLSDDEFWRSAWLTMVFVVGSGAIGTTLFGLVISLALQQAGHWLRLVVSGIVIVAWTLPPASIAIIWYAATTAGGIFGEVFLTPHANYLYSHAIWVVCFANSWSLAGLAVIIFSAALKNVPEEMLEAATLEDASVLQKLIHITLPILEPTIVTSALLMTLLSFGNFTLIYLMTQGGPNGDSNILPVYSYLQGFQFQHLGYAALLGNVIVLISGILGVAYVWVAKSRR